MPNRRTTLAPSAVYVPTMHDTSVLRWEVVGDLVYVVVGQPGGPHERRRSCYTVDELAYLVRMQVVVKLHTPPPR